jgi:PAS domain S-box-containing protein
MKNEAEKIIKKEKQKTGEAKNFNFLGDSSSSEDYIGDIFNFLPNPIFLVSSTRTILKVNPSFERITGYKAEEIIGKRIEEIFNKEKVDSLFRAAINEGFIKTEEALLFDKKKNALSVSVSVVLKKNEKGAVVGFFLGLFDLSESKRTEKALKDTQIALTNMLEDVEEARNRAEQERNKTLAIISNFTDGLLVFEKERLSLINPEAESFFNVQAKDLIGKPLSELGALPNLQPLIKLLEEETDKIFRKEIMIKENLILEVSAIPILREEKRAGILVILHNISRDKVIEKMKSEFVSLTAHQLRTPLSAIKWTLRMFMEGDLGKISKEQKEFIEKTYFSNERMIKLINDLLNVTRIEEGRYLYKTVLKDFEPVVQFMVNLYKEEAEKRNLKLKFKKPEETLPWVMLDVEKIKLAIQNLIENAMKYTPKGGLVTISLKHDKKEVELSVQDNGVGIPEDQQERVFTKFFRGANVVRMDTEGSGLGLFITKNIVEAHGGKIWFESKKDKGATFYFTLPVKKEPESFLE